MDQLANGAQTTVTKVVDVIGVNWNDVTVRCLHLTLTGVQTNQVLQGDCNVFFGQGHQTLMIATKTQLAVDLVAANACEIVALCAEEGVVQQGLCKIASRLLTWALLAVDLQQSFVGVSNTIGLQSRHHQLGEAEAFADLFFGPAQCLQQDGDWLTTLTVNTHTNGVALVHVEFEPCTAGWDDLHGVQRTLRGLINSLVKVDTRGTYQLRNNNTLGAVDNEGAFIGHHWEVTNENSLGLNFLGVVVDELCRDIQRCRVVNVFFLALIDGVFHRLKAWLRQRQRHVAGVVLNWRQLCQDIFEARGDMVLTTFFLLTLTPFRRADEPCKGFKL